jgi:hypothetical protein
MSFHVGRWVIDQRARRSSCRSPRTFRLLAGARTDSARLAPPAHRHLPLPAPARCGAFADERRVVAGDDSGRVRARAEFESMTPFTLVCSPPTFRRHARARCGAFADGAASLRATKAAACGPEKHPVSLAARLRRHYAHQSVRQTRQGSVFQSGSRGWRWNCQPASRTGVLIATFRCDTPARCGAFADERRIVVGDEGGRADAKRSSSPWGSAVPPTLCCASIGRQTRRGSRRSIRFARRARERVAPFHTGVRIATFRCNAVARSSMRGASWPATRAGAQNTGGDKPVPDSG